MIVSQSLYERIVSSFCYDGFERGGLLFLYEDSIVDMVVDSFANKDERSYTPTSSFLISQIRTCPSRSFTDYGFIHSHPANEPISRGDIYWGRMFLSYNHLDSVKLFLLQGNKLYCYLITETNVDHISININMDD